MHVEDAPAAVGLAAHGHAVADDVIARGVDGIVVGIPNGITERLHFVHLHFVAQIRSAVEKAPAQVFEDLLAADEFSMRRVENNFRVETFLKFFGVAMFKVCGAWSHGGLHLFVHCLGIDGIGGKRSDLTLEVNGDAHLIEQVDAEDTVDGAATGVADRAEVDGG